MLGDATEWLQRRTFDDQIAACFCNVRLNDGDIRIENEKAMYIYVRDKLEKGIKKLIAKMSGWKFVPDAPQQVGDCSLTNCYERYKRMSGSGMLDMGQADYDEANLESGSTFYEPVWDTPGIKSTGGGMHTMNGHVNHTFKEILAKVREKRKDCKWQQRVRNFKTELSEWKRESQEAQPITDADEALKKM